jgi:hypothetical protein
LAVSCARSMARILTSNSAELIIVVVIAAIAATLL